jgi:hypothetical protein
VVVSFGHKNGEKEAFKKGHAVPHQQLLDVTIAGVKQHALDATEFILLIMISWTMLQY